jgi:alanyl-tRNA synthetase
VPPLQTVTPLAVPLMTLRLFHQDPAPLDFTAAVVEVGAGGGLVVLDRTAFYPTSGGQPHDTGVLAGGRVVEVVEEDGRIVHRMAHPVGIRPGEVVAGAVDPPRRLDLSQQHSGQHLLSAIFADGFGLETVSVHLGETTSTLDLSGPSLEDALLAEVEDRANRVVAENRPVTVALEDAGAAARAGLRKPTGRTGPIRVVTIEGVDRSACGGTHVGGTAEIGPILLGGTERIRGDTRLTFLCGHRALRRARGDREALRAVAVALGTTPDQVPGRVLAQRDRVREMEGTVRRIQGEVAALRAAALHAGTLPGPDGLRRVLVRDLPGGMEALQSLGQACAALPGVLLLGVLGAPPAVLLAASEDSGIHAGNLLRDVLAEVGGRGGGSPRVARGVVPDSPALERVVARVVGG